MIRSIFTLYLFFMFSYVAQAQNVELIELNSFGDEEKSNPGGLQMKLFVPKNISNQAPLVVLLHGCLQTSQAYARESGWLKYAQKYNFALLVPGQTKVNNTANCFNWFLKEDNKKDKGETASIFNMITHALTKYSIDKNKIFISGFSAGASMTGVMIAHYPDLFSAAAVVAGVPYGCANSTLRGLACMGGFVSKSAKKWAAYIKDLNRDDTNYPRISIWSGNDDKIVKPMNSKQILKQWLNLHYSDKRTALVASNKQERFHTLKTYTRGKEVIIESYSIKNFPHAQPISTGNNDAHCGEESQFVKNAGICAAYYQSKFFKLF